MLRLPSSIVAIAGCVLLGIACGGSDDSGAPTPSTGIPRDDVLWFAPLAVDSLQKEAGFDVVLPMYIPKEVGPQPRYAKRIHETGITITYYPRDGQEGPLAPLIELDETPTEYTASNTTMAVIAGKPVEVWEFLGGTGTSGTSASYAVYWKQTGLWLSADFTWGGQNNRRLLLNEEMRVVARKVVESIINQEEPQQ